MREKSYWICFAVVAIANGLQLVSTVFSLAGKSFYLQLPIGSLVKRPGFHGGSNTGEWGHEEVLEVFA